MNTRVTPPSCACSFVFKNSQSLPLSTTQRHSLCLNVPLPQLRPQTGELHSLPHALPLHVHRVLLAGPAFAATLGGGSFPNSEPPLSSDAGTAAPKSQLHFSRHVCRTMRSGDISCPPLLQSHYHSLPKALHPPLHIPTPTLFRSKQVPTCHSPPTPRPHATANAHAEGFRGVGFNKDAVSFSIVSQRWCGAVGC
jgi:hypothetical protein